MRRKEALLVMQVQMIALYITVLFSDLTRMVTMQIYFTTEVSHLPALLKLWFRVEKYFQA
jgi:hypothetical protein